MARAPHSLRSRVLVFGPDEDAEKIAFPTRRFNVREITSGLPDDLQEPDERAAERRLRELRARAKAVRAVITTNMGLAETLAHDWRKAARFYARFGITEAQLCRGVSATWGCETIRANGRSMDPDSEHATLRRQFHSA